MQFAQPATFDLHFYVRSEQGFLTDLLGRAIDEASGLALETEDREVEESLGRAARELLGVAELLSRKRTGEAIEQLRRLSATMPTVAILHVALAACFLMAGQPRRASEAVQHGRQCLRGDAAGEGLLDETRYLIDQCIAAEYLAPARELLRKGLNARLSSRAACQNAYQEARRLAKDPTFRTACGDADLYRAFVAFCARRRRTRFARWAIAIFARLLCRPSSPARLRDRLYQRETLYAFLYA
jgi:hypothetical protein